MEEKLLDFDRDIKVLAQKVDWIENNEDKEKYVISFCTSKATS